jgi:hypothetical protein
MRIRPTPHKILSSVMGSAGPASDIIGEVDSLKALDLNPPNREEPLLSLVQVNQQPIHSLVRWA